MSGLSGKAAIVGIGATDFSKNSGRSELRLAAEAVTAAIADAGLTPADVDGLVSFTMDTNTEIAVARASGIGESDVLLPHPLRRRCSVFHCATGRHGRGHGCGRRRGRLSRVQ